MGTYVIQKRIHTLIEHAILEEARLSSFIRSDIQFSPWDPDLATAWRSRYWLAEINMESESSTDAWNAFNKKLTIIVSRIAFVGQAYLMHFGQPFLIRKVDSNVALVRYSQDTPGVPLSFMREDLSVLDSLLGSDDIPDEFYLYWSDATNTFGYSSKLLLMFAALESLFRRGSEGSNSVYYAKIESVLGSDLKRELYGTREDPQSGLRQRLVHGEYLGTQDTRNYVEEIHKRIVRYFNAEVLGGDYLNENIVNPQRHFFGNSEEWTGFIKPEAEQLLELKPIVRAFDADSNNPEGYLIVPPEERPASY